MTTLTDRYVHAATHRLPESQRDDVARELRASIEDQSEAALAANPLMSASEAEEQALATLGDPSDLAAQYRGDQQYLIGPDLYPGYLKLLRTLLPTLVPLVTTVVVLVDISGGESLGSIIASLVATAVSVAAQIFVWVTVGFAIADRVGAGKELNDALGSNAWTPDQLPELPKRSRISLAETVASIAWLAVLGGLIAWQQVRSPISDSDGQAIPFLDPDLWSFWIPLILVTLLAEAALEVAKYRAGSTWTTAFAALNTVLGLLIAAPVLWLAAQESLLNPALITHIQENWSAFDPGLTHTAVALIALVIWALDSLDGWSRTLRS